MGGLEVHEHQLFTVFSEGSHPVGVHADPVHTCKKFWAMVIGSKSRETMSGDPLHTCKEVSANGGRIEVEGHYVRLRIMVSKSHKTRWQQAGWLEKLRPRFDDGRVHVARACSQPQGT